MRVSFLLEQTLAPVPGGTGRYAREVAGALADVPGTTVRGVTAWHRDVTPARVAGVAGPRRLGLPRRPLTAAWERGTGPGASWGADLVHAPTLLAPPRRRVPVVVTIHDAVPWTHPETLTPRGVRWHRRMAERVAAEADLVVVPTHSVADELSSRLRPRRVEVVGEGVGAAVSRPPIDAAERAARLDLPSSGYLLSLATLEPRKGLDVLVRALAAPLAPDLPLLVVGQQGWGDQDLTEQAAAAGLAAGRVRVLGRLTDEDLATVLARATALVVPSRAEGFGLPVLEGMAMGTPVVISDAAALVEVAGGAARIAPVGDADALADALADVAADAPGRRDMAARGRVRAEHYSWAAAGARLVQLYGELLGG